jgi:hypothetical protein
MKSRPVQWTLGIALLMSLMPAALPAATATAEAGARNEEAYAGKWVGTYASESGGSGNVTYILSKDDKGQWHGTVTYTNQEGERTAELKELAIAGTKFKAKIDSPGGESEITLEGKFGEKAFAGTYSVLDKSSGEIAEKGTWKTAKT